MRALPRAGVSARREVYAVMPFADKSHDIGMEIASLLSPADHAPVRVPLWVPKPQRFRKINLTGSRVKPCTAGSPHPSNVESGRSAQRAAAVGDPLELPPVSGSERKASGETVFDDRPLRFRSLTLAEADLSDLESPSGFHNGFKIRVAKLGGRKREAGQLVERRYAGRGYAFPAPGEDPQLSTFIAYDEGALVGTVSVRLDSERGLSADEHYRDEVDALRRDGAHLCEFTRLAVDKTVASKPVLAGLFHTAYLYAAVIRGCTHSVIEVNPRHVAYYQRALAFEPIGDERLNTRVNAPAVLLCGPFRTIADRLARFAGKPDVPGAGRSLFLYGFPADEEVGVLRRLRGLIAESAKTAA